MKWLSSVVSWFEGDSASVAWAMAGGVIVALGLLFEKLAEILNERYSILCKPYKNLEWFGWGLLMLGIFIEVGDAGVTAHNLFKADPRNQPISVVSATVSITVKGQKNVESVEYTNGSPSAANLFLSSEIVSFTNVLYLTNADIVGGKKVGEWIITIRRPSGRPGIEPIGVPGFPILNSDRFEIIPSGNMISLIQSNGRAFGIPGSVNGHPDFHTYEMQFHSDANSDLSNVGVSKTAKSIREIKALWVGFKFLPHDAEILGGIAVVNVNSLKSVFIIPPQKNSNLEPDSPGSSGNFELITTNLVQTIEK